MKQRLLAVLLALHGLYPIPATGQASKFLPHDEASQQPDFFSFRARLLVSLAGRDTTGLLNVVAPEIRNTFGDDNGVNGTGLNGAERLLGFFELSAELRVFPQ